MIVEWLFSCVTLVSYGSRDYGLVIHELTHFGKKYDVKVGGTRGGGAKGSGAKEVIVIGYGHLWIQRFGAVIYEENSQEKRGVGGDKKYCGVGIDYIEKRKRCMIKKKK
eukprot:95380_1